MPVVPIVPIVAVQHIRKQRLLVERLRDLKATSPANAQSQAALGVTTDMTWRHLEKGAVIRAAPNGGYYVDEAAWEALNRARHHRARIAVTVVVIVMIAIGIAIWAFVPRT